LSVNVFEKTPFYQLVTERDYNAETSSPGKQLNLFD
jgi:hypothetical protein